MDAADVEAITKIVKTVGAEFKGTLPGATWKERPDCQ